ncbi:MAG: hypothetical protein AAF960_19195 [Bacteroidota bacterium]
MQKRILLMLVFVVSAVGLSGQTMRQYKKAVDEALAKQEYHAALLYIEKIQKTDTTDLDLQYKQAQAARLFNAFILAEKRYQQIIHSEAATKYPEAEFWLASVQKSQGKYDAAITHFSNFIEDNPTTLPELVAEAKEQIQACEWAKELIKFKDKDLRVTYLGENINTVHSDFAPLKTEGGLIFSSLQFQSSKDKAKNPRKYAKVLQLKDMDSQPEPYDLGYSDEEVHTAHLAFNNAKDRIYFNICNYTEGSIIKCKLFYKDKMGDGWGPSVELPAYINAPQATTTQPNLGYIQELRKEVLFFVTDRVGGKGGLDIWYSVIDEDNLPGIPKNLVLLNTNKDEFSPFFHNYSQDLYFSSDGRKSLGGFDIYKSNYQEQWQKVEHTGYPLNSSYNDLYFSLSQDGSEGFFVSNREGTQLLEKDISACCNDIFEAAFNSFFIDLKVLTFRDANGEKIDLSDAKVTVYELFDDVKKEIKASTQPAENAHFFRIKSNKNYRILAEKDGLIPKTITFNTDTVKVGEEVVKELTLGEGTLELLTYNGDLSIPLNEADIQLYELDNRGKRKTPIKMRRTKKNSYYFPIELDRNYEITASKSGFKPATETFASLQITEKSKVITKKIILFPDGGAEIKLDSLKPFPLYFDNDHPNPNTTDTLTGLSFPETIAAYKLKKADFKKGYAEGLSGEAKRQAEAAVENFFEVEMDTSYREFLKFTDAVLTRLEFKRTVEITVEAFTSPLASDEYNLALSKRRISSMLNFYRTYKYGAMKKYVDNGQLTINLESYGESRAPKTISDNKNDRRNSVYSLEASRQRRVEIKRVNTEKQSQRPKFKISSGSE